MTDYDNISLTDESAFQVGDFIRCKDRDDMLNTMHDLIFEGINTEFIYEHNGQSGLWLEVISIDV